MLDLLPYIVPAITGAVGFFAGGKRRREVTTDKSEIENLKQIIEVQKNSIAFLSGRIEVLEKQITEINKKCDNCSHRTSNLNPL